MRSMPKEPSSLPPGRAGHRTQYKPEKKLNELCNALKA